MGRGVCQVLKETGCDRTRGDCPFEHYSLEFHPKGDRKGNPSHGPKKVGVLRKSLFFMSSSHTFTNKIIIKTYKQLKPEGLDSKKSSSRSRQPGGASLGLSALAGRLQRGGTPQMGGGLVALNSCHHKPCPH